MPPWQIFSNIVQYGSNGCNHGRCFQILSNLPTMDATMAYFFKYCPICQGWMPPWKIFFKYCPISQQWMPLWQIFFKYRPIYRLWIMSLNPSPRSSFAVFCRRFLLTRKLTKITLFGFHVSETMGDTVA